MDFRNLQLYKFPILMGVCCLLFYFSFAYQLEREDFVKLICLYAGLFFLSFKLIQMQKHNFWILVSLAIIFRLIFLAALPNLSQDFFRFIWDGRLLANGFNPYASIPNAMVLNPELPAFQSELLLNGMGTLSASNFTNYAPINQFIFMLAGWLPTSSLLFPVILFRLIIIAADLGVIYFGDRFLKSLGIPEYRIFWYALNPFVIIELTGNLHFEGVMVFFLVWSLYLLHQKKWFWSAVLFGLSISVKLLPLMLLPLFFKYFTKPELREGNLSVFTKLVIFYTTAIGVFILSFLPFYSEEVLMNFMGSIGLWFGKFEFNASFYYIVRWIGYEITGYNIIQTAGKILPLITVLIILGLSFFRKNETILQLVQNMMFSMTAYLLLSTTVHPWYLTIPLLLSVFTEFRYMIIWTFLVFLSYFTYAHPDFKENTWVLMAEYGLLLGYLLLEIRKKDRPFQHLLS